LDKRILVFGGESDIASAIIKDGYETIFCPVKECDITIQNEVKKALKKYKPEVVVNCAGISNVQLVKNSNVKKWLDEININLIGSYFIARESAEAGVDAMIFLASVAGKYGKPEHSGYSASKCAVISLVQSLGLEGYNAYSISPGRVDTKMREKDYPGEDRRTRLPREDVAKVIFDCIEGLHDPGDNIIVRKRGFRKLSRVDKGAPWKEYLNVQPYGTPKEI